MAGYGYQESSVDFGGQIRQLGADDWVPIRDALITGLKSTLVAAGTTALQTPAGMELQSTVATKAASSGGYWLVDWVLANKGKAALYAGLGLVGIAATTLIIYRGIKGGK